MISEKKTSGRQTAPGSAPVPVLSPDTARTRSASAEFHARTRPSAFMVTGTSAVARRMLKPMTGREAPPGLPMAATAVADTAPIVASAGTNVPMGMSSTQTSSSAAPTTIPAAVSPRTQPMKGAATIGWEIMNCPAAVLSSPMIPPITATPKTASTICASKTGIKNLGRAEGLVQRYQGRRQRMKFTAP